MEFHLDWLEFWTFFYCVKKNPYVEIFKKIYFLSVEIKIHTWKNPKICPWKFWLPVKSYKIVCVKAIFCTWKNSQKGQNTFHEHFWFSRGKKKRCSNHYWKGIYRRSYSSRLQGRNTSIAVKKLLTMVLGRIK